MKFFLKTLLLCGSFQSYRQFCFLSVTSSIRYVLKIVAVLGLILLFSLTPWALRHGDRFSQWIDQNIPSCRIQEGKIISEVEQPYFAGNKEFMFILDTKEEVAITEQDAMQGVLFTEDQLLFWVKPPSGSTEDISIKTTGLSGLPNGTINGLYFRRLLRSFLWAWLPILWGVIILAGTLSASLQALLFSAIATCFGRYTSNQLPMNVLLNISLHAVAPAAIVFTLFAALRIHEVDLWVVYLVVYGVFLFGATNACRESIQIENSDKKIFPKI